ncbi:MAG: cupin domain-containing protein [Candidatus Aminicenantes bacterium]|nr:cupin domain-containing protein [Candidatus Aminicenantes bacterium]
MSFLNLTDFAEKEPVPGYKVRFIHTDNMTFAYWNIDAGASLPEHSHPHEQVANIIEGRFDFNLEGEKRIIEPGDIVAIPSNARHGGRAVTDCRIIDVFYPIREDYKK